MRRVLSVFLALALSGVVLAVPKAEADCSDYFDCLHDALDRFEECLSDPPSGPPNTCLMQFISDQWVCGYVYPCRV